LHLAVGLVAAECGRVTVLGVSPRAAMVRGDVGFVAQDKPLYRRFRVGELLRMGAALNLRWDQGYAAQRLDSVGIDLRKRAGSLSGGEQAQVALTLALAKRPRLLLLDEPGAALDPLARRAFLDDVRCETSARGITVVHSSHDVAELDRACETKPPPGHNSPSKRPLDTQTPGMFWVNRPARGPRDWAAPSRRSFRRVGIGGLTPGSAWPQPGHRSDNT
jgi:ABC-type Mn2+/Zn2+ transport system ATPase subunit